MGNRYVTVYGQLQRIEQAKMQMLERQLIDLTARRQQTLDALDDDRNWSGGYGTTLARRLRSLSHSTAAVSQAAGGQSGRLLEAARQTKQAERVYERHAHDQARAVDKRQLAEIIDASLRQVREDKL